ncbi:MAG: hypothetical protein RSB25_18835, partial [Acinetobacter sp.]
LTTSAAEPVRDLKSGCCKTRGETPVDNVLQDPESVYIVHREKLRSVCRHESHPLEAAIAVVRL